MDISRLIIDTLTNIDLMSAISSSVIIILLGFYLRKRGIIGESCAKSLSKVLLAAAIPALAFSAFMQNINPETLRQGANVLIWGIVIYVLLILLTKVTYGKYPRDKQDVLRVLTIFGSTTFFGIPIISAIFGAEGAMLAAIFNIGYRIFLYSYGYIKMSGLKMERKNIKSMFLNPIILATILGLIIWVTQEHLPQVNVGEVTVSFLRVDETLFWLYRPVIFLSSLASPLAWLSIGATLAEISMKEAAKEKDAWYYTFIKILIVPLFNLICLVLLKVTGIMPVSYVALATMIIMMATPTATVAAAYAIGFDKEAVLASNCSLLSTIIGVLSMPIWIVILEIINSFNIF